MAFKFIGAIAICQSVGVAGSGEPGVDGLIISAAVSVPASDGASGNGGTVSGPNTFDGPLFSEFCTTMPTPH